MPIVQSPRARAGSSANRGAFTVAGQCTNSSAPSRADPHPFRGLHVPSMPRLRRCRAAALSCGEGGTYRNEQNSNQQQSR
jgi:hypothetical protein